MPGTVITFYSYKGGVGRSFTLANIAILLARWGSKVLCLDWDLEAPGLHHYFRPLMTAPADGGVIDLVADFLADETGTPADHRRRLTTAGVVDFIAAGRDDPDYGLRMQAIDWDRLYGQGFGDYLERCRDRWIDEYDFVLIDSRTGVSDIGGICTAQLPDRLVLLFTANEQSVRGAVDIANRAAVARDRLPYDRPLLTVLPVLSRFDSREEYARAEEWRAICFDATKDFYGNWINRTVEPDVVSRHLTVPYVSYWTFGEQIAVRAETTPAADQISFALETVAAVIAHHFDHTDLLAENRDAYVAAIRVRKQEHTYDIRVSSQRSTLEQANALIAELEKLGVRAKLSLSAERSFLFKIEDDAKHLCLLVDRSVSRWQSAEVELFLHRSLGQDRKVIPVLTPETEPNTLPGYVGNLRYLRLGPSRGAAEVARGLVDQLAGVTGLVDSGEIDLSGMLRQAGQADLRPALWGLVDELVDALLKAAVAGDDVLAQDLATDLALVLRPRPVPGDDDRVPAPAWTQDAIDMVVRVLDSRVRGREDVRQRFTGSLED